MGHLVGKDLYRELGRKIDSLTVRAPLSETLYAVLTELYSPEEAEVFVKMSYTFSVSAQARWQFSAQILCQ